MIWISNYSYGEILTFDLDGNHIASYPGRYRVLDTSDTSLYAFQDYSIYRWDASADTFAFIKELPDNVRINQARYGTNVKVGSNRLCVWVNDSLKVYPLLAYLYEQQYDTVFTDSVYAIPYMAIMNDKIIWATEYGSTYRIADLNGNNRTDGSFGVWTYLLDFCADNNLYLTGSGSLKKYDQNLNEMVNAPRSQYYWDGRFFGGDDQNLYFYDFHDGGVIVAPLDFVQGVFLVNEHNEIPYSGWNHEFRLSAQYGLLLSEWPPDTLNIYRFDFEEMTSLKMPVDSAFGFDIVNDTVFALIGTALRLFDINGDSLTTIPLSGLQSSNLHDLNRESYIHFAANGEYVFVVYHDTLNIFNHFGEFESVYRYYIRSDDYSTTLLYADDAYVYSNWALMAINIETGEVSNFVDQQAHAGGFIWGGRYWYESGKNIFTYTNIDVVSSTDKSTKIPNEFKLLPAYPNPFNPLTTIRYQLGQSARVKLTVYNVLGQRVRTLVDIKQLAGSYQVKWSGENFSSGVYLFLLEADNFRAATKGVLLK